MAHMAQSVEIRRDGSNLVFGKNVYHLEHAESVWVNQGKERTVFLRCNNNGYLTLLEFQMRDIQETNRLIREIVQNHKIHVSLPHINKLRLETDPQSQNTCLKFEFNNDEDQALHDEYTQPLVDRLLDSGQTADQIYRTLRENTAPPSPQMDLASRVQRVHHYLLPANAADDHASDGSLEILQIPNDEGKSYQQIGFKDRIDQWMATPTEAGDQIARYAEILKIAFDYQCRYSKDNIRPFYNYVVKMGIFSPHLQTIFGVRLAKLQATSSKAAPSPDSKETRN